MTPPLERAQYIPLFYWDDMILNADTLAVICDWRTMDDATNA